jgi:hypothetical protein
MQKNLIILLILPLLWSCHITTKETDVDIINQIFPDLVAEIRISIIEPFPPIPPLPASLSPSITSIINPNLSDSCINKSDLMAYLSSLNKYRQDFHKYIFDSYAFDYDSINTVLGIVDSLYSCKGYKEFDYIKKELPSLQYTTAYHNMSIVDIANKKIDLNKITNSGIFKLQYSSQLGWHPKVNRKFWEKQNGFYLSGILRFSRIYFDDSYNSGVFYCTNFYGPIEPLSLLICIKKTDNKWKIEKSILM